MEIVRPAEDCAGYRIYVKDDVPLNRSDNEEFLQAGIENAVDLKPEDLKKKGKAKKEAHVNSVKVHHVEVINMIKVLFICHGNICRSPMAEFIFKEMVKKHGLEDQFLIKSAATSTEEIWNGIGNPVYPPAKKELARHGISCDKKRAVQMCRADYEKYEYLIGMDDQNISNMIRIAGGDPAHKIYKLLMFANDPGDIADPWYTGEFGRTYEDIVRGCEGLLKHLVEK